MVREGRAPAHLRQDWLGYSWTAWMPLNAAHPLALGQLPLERGLYRIRRAGSDRLEWIGWAERGVREVVERLSRQAHLPVEPYDDPTVPAHRLWRRRRDEGVSFEVSGAALPATTDGHACAERARVAYRSDMSDLI